MMHHFSGEGFGFLPIAFSLGPLYAEASQREGGGAVEKGPVITHISRMIEQLDDESIRALYMVVKQMCIMQGHHNTETTPTQYKVK